VLIKPCAAAVIAVLPTEGKPSLIFSDPPSAKNAATHAASWLHQAAVYFFPNSCNFKSSIQNAHKSLLFYFFIAGLKRMGDAQPPAEYGKQIQKRKLIPIHAPNGAPGA